METEMDENTFWLKLWSRIMCLAAVLIIAITTYSTVDRVYQGHSVIVSPQTVIPVK